MPRDIDDVVTGVLNAIGTGEDLPSIVSSVAPAHDRSNRSFPGEVLVRLGADALDQANVGRGQRVAWSGIRERYLPERAFSGNSDHQKSNSVLRLVVLIHAGFDVDFDEEVGWWKADDFWLYALYALVISIRAASDLMGVRPAALCERLARLHGIDLRLTS